MFFKDIDIDIVVILSYIVFEPLHSIDITLNMLKRFEKI